MVDGAITEPTEGELERMDREAVRLTGIHARERLRLGDALVALDRDFQELGFRNLASYARERVGFGARWVSDTRALARRLKELPCIRRALVRREIRWSMAELLARHATPDDEEELLDACRGETVRAVRRILKERGEEPEPEPDVTERYGSIERMASVPDAMAMEAARRQVELVNGGPGEPGSWLECLCFEVWSTLEMVAPEAFEQEAAVAARAQIDGWIEARRAAEQRNVDAEERARPTPLPMPDEAEEEEEDEALPADPVALDRIIRERANRIASGDVWLGKLLERLFAARAWQRLGYATETQYATDRLGMSRSAVRARITFTRRARWLDGLDEAVQSGTLRETKAALVARVATPDTLDDWIGRAAERTHKHLTEEVQLAELIARFGREAHPPEPPCEELVREWHAVEADWLSGAQTRRFMAANGMFVDEERVSPAVAMIEDAGEEPVRQVGAHVEATEAALAEMLRRRAAHGESDAPPAVQMSVGFEHEAPTPSGDEPVVQMSVGSETAPATPEPSCLGARPPQADAPSASPTPPRLPIISSEGAPPDGRSKPAPRKVPVRIVAREDVIAMFLALEAAFAQSGLPGTLFGWMVVAFWREWGPLFEIGNRWKHLHDRDRHQCACPVCTVRKSLSNHHIVFKSHGGSDAPSNQILGCDFHHIDGVHAGRLSVRGTAERPIWTLGRAPIMRIVGRKLEEIEGRSSVPA